MLNAFLTNTISFPGLGIGEFKIDPVAFRIPIPWKDGASHPIMWYGIIITLAMIAGFLITMRNAKKEGIKGEHIYDLAIFLMIFCIIGARLYYVLMAPNKRDYDTFGEIIAIWNGGLAIYGGVIAGAITVFVVSKVKKINTFKLLDCVAPALILGQAIGRWGNFMNAEAYGAETKLPWRMCSPQIAEEMYFDDNLINYSTYNNMLDGSWGVHPTFLYESLWCILGFVLIMLLMKKRKFDGQSTLTYLIWYGTGRFFIEGLRTDSLYLMADIFGERFRVSQLVSIAIVIAGVVLMIVGLALARRRRLDSLEYVEVYSPSRDIELGLRDVAAFDIKPEETAEKPAEYETEKEN